MSQEARQHGVKTMGSVCHFGVLFLVVNTLLWVKHLLFCILLLLITIVVVTVHFLFHCFALLINCYFNPYSVLYCPSPTRRGRGKEVAYLECSSLPVSKPAKHPRKLFHIIEFLHLSDTKVLKNNGKLVVGNANGEEEKIKYIG